MAQSTDREFEYPAQRFDYPSSAHAQCPFPALEEIRAAGSVHQIGEKRFIVSHYDDVDFVFRHPELFSNNSEERLQPFDWPGPEGVPPESLGKGGHVLNVIELDPPHHKRRRDRMFQFVKPAVIASYRPWIAELVDGLIDGFIDDGRVELMSQFAYPLPTQVIIRILGLEAEDFGWMHAWGIVEWSGGAIYMTDEERLAQAPENADSAGPRVTAEILKRYENPRDDGLSKMIQAQIDDDGEFNLGIVRADLGQFVRAGIMTTGHVISSALLLLMAHPDVMAQVAEDHSKLRLTFEEALRLESPLQWIPRIARQDVELGGVMIPEGSYVIPMIQSANRDEAKWGPNACAFDPSRADVIDHMGFGKGIHFCLGAPLGRIEAQIAFERLLARLKNIRVPEGETPRFMDSPTFRGLERFVLEFDRA